MTQSQECAFYFTCKFMLDMRILGSVYYFRGTFVVKKVLLSIYTNRKVKNFGKNDTELI